MRFQTAFTHNKKLTMLAVIMLLAAILRFIVLYKYGLSLTLNSDDEGYRNAAYVFLEKWMVTYHDASMPTVHIMPGQVFLLAGVFSIFGKGTVGVYAAKMAMILFGLITVYGTYKLGSIIMNEYVGLIASFLVAIFIPQVLADNLLLTESPFTALSLMLFYFSVKLGHKQDWKTFFFVLALYVLCLYLRPQIALYPIILLVYLAFKKYPWKLMAKQLGVASIALVLVLGPWWIRNYVHFHEFIPLSGGAGNPLLLGTFQGVGYPDDMKLDDILNKAAADNKGKNTYYVIKEQEEIAKERIKTWFTTHPKEYLFSLFLLKPIVLWNTQFYWIKIFNISPELIKMIGRLFLIIGFVGVLTSFVFERKARAGFLMLFLILGYFTLLNSYYFAFDRYNLPLMPIVFIFAGYIVYKFVEAISHLVNHGINKERNLIKYKIR